MSYNKKNHNKRYNRRSPYKKGHKRNPNKNYKKTGADKIQERYHALKEQYLRARKKYFDLFNRTEGEARKSKEAFYRSLKQLREFEERNPNKKENNMDLTYSTNHSLATNNKKVDISKTENIHMLPSQKNHDYAHDKEDSKGTLDDYKRIKEKTL